MSEVAEFIRAISTLVWPAVVVAGILLLRVPLGDALHRLERFEGWGMKVGLSGVSLAMQARPDLAASVAPLLAERLRREWKRLEGAEILWVDDRPSRNRLEARMFQGFGARVTFAASSEEAQDALGAVALGRPPFDLIISNIGRSGRDEGLEMLEHFRAAGVSIPMVFYVGRLLPGLPKGAQGITNRPDELAGLVLDALDRRDPR